VPICCRFVFAVIAVSKPLPNGFGLGNLGDWGGIRTDSVLLISCLPNWFVNSAEEERKDGVYSMSKSRFLRWVAVVMASFLLVSSSLFARAEFDTQKPDGGTVAAAAPEYAIVTHNIGKIALAVTNKGVFGDGFTGQTGIRDSFTGELVPSCEYPKGSNTRYLFAGAFWIGAVVGRDTLVSVGADGWSSQQEFNPESEENGGGMKLRSTIDPAKPEYIGAVSEQDFICTYYDTCVNCPGGGELDYLDQRAHQPLHIQVDQASYAWSYEYAEDFVLFDYGITNIGDERLRRVFMGLYVDADVHHNVINGQIGAQDDICGFVHGLPAFYLPDICAADEPLNIAWISDNDADENGPPGTQVPHVTGMRVVRTPSDSLEISFNWWISNASPALDFGPQTRQKYRDYGTGGSGTPEGDRNKYHVLSNGEFDYDQIFTADIGALDPVWLPPNPNVAVDLSNGYDTRYLLSFGPFDIEPGQTLPLSFAYVAGANFYATPGNIQNLQEGTYDPLTYYEGLNFDDLGKNGTWAEWIYDNPGVDTDSDGYYGVAYECTVSEDNIEVYWRKGDGVPDFRGASPPPAPILRVRPHVGQIVVLFNGALSETTVDNFSGYADFEGYRVYMARDDRSSSYQLLTSFDFEDFNKWNWRDDSAFTGFELVEAPFSLDSLRCLYAPEGCNDTIWNPLDHGRNNPFFFTRGGEDSIVYFEPQDFNRSELGVTTDIVKAYPDSEMIKPTLEWIEDTTTIPLALRDSVLTPEGYFKWYEYKYVIDSLLPTVPYWINVTAFDFGSPSSGLPSLETSPTVQPKITYALESIEDVMAEEDLDVYVYPNPYRLDANYRANGFEGRGSQERDRPDDRVRRIHFANLPPKCTIRIYSLDGDLVREIFHDIPPSDPRANHDTWDLITRNTQIVVSGLYYWSVETPDGKTQVGKVAIIL
jgi:hypothetical protein